MDTILFDGEPSPDEELREMDDRTLLMEIYKFVLMLKKNYDAVVSNIEIDSRTMKQLINMSERAVCRWRKQKKLRYHVRPDGSLYYRFEELYIDVKSGRLDGRNFNRIETLARMKSFFNGVIKRNNLQTSWEDDYDE